MGTSSPTHKTGKGAYDGAMPQVIQFGLLTGATTASAASVAQTMPFDTKVKEVGFDVTDTLVTAGTLVNLRVGGTAVATKDIAGLATGYHAFSEAEFTTTFKATDKAVLRGQRLTMTLINRASVAGRGTAVMNPL